MQMSTPQRSSLLRLTLIYTSQHTVSFTTDLKPERRSNEDKYLKKRSKAAEINDIDSSLTHYVTIYMKNSLNIDI